MRIRLEQDFCSGHGRCYMLAPEVYDEDERGHCVLKHTEVPAELEAKAREGADACPESAIVVEDD